MIWILFELSSRSNRWLQTTEYERTLYNDNSGSVSNEENEDDEDGDTDNDTDSDENNYQGSGDEEEDQAGKLRAVWSSFRSPPTKEQHVTGSWYAIIYDGKKGILHSVFVRPYSCCYDYVIPLLYNTSKYIFNKFMIFPI